MNFNNQSTDGEGPTLKGFLKFLFYQKLRNLQTKGKKGEKEKGSDSTHLHSVLNPSGRHHDQGLGDGKREYLVTGC
jgi:hypothetical protein